MWEEIKNDFDKIKEDTQMQSLDALKYSTKAFTSDLYKSIGTAIKEGKI